MTDIEKAIAWFENQNKYYDDKEAYQEDYHMNVIALAALHAEQERTENKPLTLDELKQMDGEPVYAVGGGGYAAWVVVNAKNEHCVDNESGAWKFYYYGITNPENVIILHPMGWVAYRHKPQEAT